MKRVFRPFAWILLLLSCLALGFSRCQTEHPASDPLAAEKAALWQTLSASRPAGDEPDGQPALSVTFIDVGQGDCVLLLAPDGKAMLVDAGPSDAFPAIETALSERGVTALDVVIATHPHDDHIGSMAAVLNRYPVGAFYTIADEQPTGSCAAMLAALEKNGCPVYPADADERIPWADECTVTVLNPDPDYDYGTDELNDRSVVLHVQYGDTAVLLTGDAEAAAERRMLDTYPKSMLRADVLKLGHHGSASSTTVPFFLAVDPDFAVASCGTDNDYGHPHLETLSLLYETHTAFYRTDCDGTITFRLDGTRVSVDPIRKENP